MVTAGADRQHARVVHGAVKGRNVGDLRLEVEAAGEAYVADVGDAAEFVGIEAHADVECTHQARRIADFARAVSGTGSIGDAEVRRYADETDVDAIERTGERRAHKRCELGVAWFAHRLVLDPVNNSASFVIHNFTLAFDVAIGSTPGPGGRLIRLITT